MIVTPDNSLKTSVPDFCILTQQGFEETIRSGRSII